MCGMRYSPVAGSLSVSMAMRAGRVHRRVPGHVGHVEEQRVDRIGIAVPGVGDHHVHQAVGGERRLPGERLVDAPRRAVGLDQQVLRPDAESRAAGRPAACSAPTCSACRRAWAPADAARDRAACSGSRPGVSMAPSSICSRWMRAAGVEAVGMGRDAAHRMHARPAGRRSSSWRRPAQSVQGWSMHDRLLEGGVGELGGDAADGRRRRCRSARGHRVGGVLRVEIALGQQLEDRHGAAAVGQRHRARQRRRDVGTGRPARRGRCGSSQTSGLPSRVAREQAVIGGAGRLRSPARARWCSGRR